MVKMEIDFTDEQIEKIEILKSKGVDVGEAIDLLFAVQKEIIIQVEEETGEEPLLEKVVDTGFDTKIKQRLLKKNFDEDKTYDILVHDKKHKVKWSDLFK